MSAPLLLLLSAFLWGEGGTTAMPLLRVGQGVRAASLGEAYIGLAADASAIYWNPAGLGSVRDFELALSHHQSFSDLRDEVFHSAVPAGPGSVGFGVLYSTVPGIEGWDESNRPTYEFSTSEAVATLGYGARIRRFRFGLAAKGLFQSTHTDAGYGGALDLGLAGRVHRDVQLGFAARNFGSLYRADNWEMLPAELGLGASWSRSGLSAAADIIYPMDIHPNVRAGIEYLPVPELALRLGYRTGPADLVTLGYSSGFTAGLGVALGDVGIDYAFAPQGKLGAIHRIGLRVRAVRRYTGHVRITVMDAGTLTPLWATVSTTGALETEAGTNRQGELKLTGIPPGRLIIRTACDGYAPRADTLEVLGDREQRATIVLRGLDYGDIWAVLYDAETRGTIGGTVSYQGPVYGEQQVDARLGSFALKSIPVGTYVLRATGPSLDYHPQTCTLEVQKGTVTETEFHLIRQPR